MHRPERLSFTLRNQRSEIERMFSLVEPFCRANQIVDDRMLDVRLVLDEAIINIIVHGYQDRLEHRIHVSLILEAQTLTIHIDDDATAYNPLDAAPPRFDLPIEERRIGGLGVHIIKALARSVEYRRAGGHNHLVITMQVGAESGTATAT
jgi:anti-sigma regulatory factor (Ser/Thr protein kinase)